MMQESIKTGRSSSEVVAYARSGHPFVVQVGFFPTASESAYGEASVSHLFCFITPNQQSFLTSNIHRITAHDDDASELTGD